MLRTIEYWVMDESAKLDIDHACILDWSKTFAGAQRLLQQYSDSVIVQVSVTKNKTIKKVVYPCQDR